MPKKGDDSRHFGPPYIQHKSEDTSRTSGQRRTATHFPPQNRNKRGITLNLKHPKGLKLALDLARESDMIIENVSHPSNSPFYIYIYISSANSWQTGKDGLWL